jgi:hypothetical protein
MLPNGTVSFAWSLRETCPTQFALQLDVSAMIHTLPWSSPKRSWMSLDAPRVLSYVRLTLRSLGRRACDEALDGRYSADAAG